MANFYYNKNSYMLLRISLKSVALNTFLKEIIIYVFLFSLSHVCIIYIFLNIILHFYDLKRNSIAKMNISVGK